jgi:competence protein ComEA
VRRPGLYQLAEGVRVAAAVERAGGPLPRADLGAINLAARVVDGQQVVVPALVPGPVGAPPSAAGGEEAGPIGLGSATVEQLEQLDGIGPTLAARIVEHRGAIGGFASLDQLDDVEGIGEGRLAALRDALVP